MPARAKPVRRYLIGGGIAAVLVTLAAIPTYLALAPAWRTLAVRLVCAVAVAAGCVRAVRWARGVVQAEDVSPLDAPPPPGAGPELDARFLALRDDVIYGTRSRRYFDVILWPRLSELAGTELPRPAARRGIRRRGPSMSELSHLVAEIEGHP
jgi:hypothetical protein